MRYFKNQITPYKDRELQEHLPFRVYRNLHAKTEDNRYSILQAGVVVAHARQLTIFSPKFIVSKKGQERAQKLKHKTVHAFIEGRFRREERVKGYTLEKVQYNYYGQPLFFTVNEDGEFMRYVEKADAVLLCSYGVLGFNCS